MDIWTIVWAWIIFVLVVNVLLALAAWFTSLGRPIPPQSNSGEGETFHDWLNELNGTKHAE